jgi:hypothetical protein
MCNSGRLPIISTQRSFQRVVVRVQKVWQRISKKVRDELSRQAARDVTSLHSLEFAANLNFTARRQHFRVHNSSHDLIPPYKMATSTSRALGRYVCQFRSSPSLLRPATASLAQQRTSRRWASTEATNPKIATIVDQISQLTLLETADLVSTLKVSQ